MDLNLTPAEESFRQELLDWLKDNLPVLGSALFCGTVPPFPSSIRWMQSPGQTLQEVGSGNFALQDLASSLVAALTRSTAEERRPHLVALLQALGHIVHLVQDATQPQHVRMETHLLGSPLEAFADTVLARDPARRAAMGRRARAAALSRFDERDSVERYRALFREVSSPRSGASRPGGAARGGGNPPP